MRTYLGEMVLNLNNTEYRDYTSKDWVISWIEMYGSVDGAHHKDWLLDQIVRILKGTKVIVSLAQWDDGTEEERFILEDATLEYHQWVDEISDAGYSYDVGIAP